MFNAISVCFPNTFQAYYDTLLEPFFDATLSYLVGLEKSVSYPCFIVALVLGWGYGRILDFFPFRLCFGHYPVVCWTCILFLLEVSFSVPRCQEFLGL